MSGSDEALAWVASCVGSGSRVTHARVLKGGITSAVHGVNVTDRTGSIQRFVLRRWVDENDRQRFTYVDREARTLRALEPTAVPSPVHVASDPDGSRSGGDPALLMTRLPGRMLLDPSDPQSWIEQMADALVQIHELVLDSYPFEDWLHVEDRPVPSWTTRPDVWRDAMAFLRDTSAPMELRFIHHDYQHFNMLWSREKLSGIVDWVFASLGPRDVDVAHCRRNLAVLFSAERADAFLRAYESRAGRTVEPWWDIATLVDYSEHWPKTIPLQVAGRIPVDVVGMSGRIEETLVSALARV